MTRFESSYSPGSWVAVMAESAWMLIDVPVTADKLARAWTALRGAQGADAVLDILLEDGLASLAPFALVTAEADGVRVIVRRPCVVVVDGETISASGGTWSDQHRSNPVESISLAVDGTPGGSVTLPMNVGISQAAALTLTALDIAAPVLPEDVSPVDVEPTDPEPELELEPEPEPEVEPEPESEPPGEIEPVTEEGPGAVDYADLFAGTTSRNALLERLAAEEKAVSTATAAPVAQPEVDLPSASEGERDDGSHTATWADFTAPETEPEPEPAPTPPPSRTGLIDGLPWETGGVSASPPPPPPPHLAPEPVPDEVRPAPAPSTAVDDEDDEIEIRTMSRSELLASLQTVGPAGPTVLAVTCPSGHTTSPYLDACRVCGVAVDTSTPREISRPTLGVLILSTGEKVSLDRDVVLGRAPQTTRHDAATKPHQVKLGDPGISRNHVLISLNGWDVMARDLGSSNGTEIVLPGGEPQKLRPEEDYLVEPGSNIVLAEEVTLTFMVPS